MRREGHGRACRFWRIVASNLPLQLASVRPACCRVLSGTYMFSTWLGNMTRQSAFARVRWRRECLAHGSRGPTARGPLLTGGLLLAPGVVVTKHDAKVTRGSRPGTVSVGRRGMTAWTITPAGRGGSTAQLCTTSSDGYARELQSHARIRRSKRVSSSLLASSHNSCRRRVRAEKRELNKSKTVSNKGDTGQATCDAHCRGSSELPDRSALQQ